jgi:hypothetical protein
MKRRSHCREPSFYCGTPPRPYSFHSVYDIANPLAQARNAKPRTGRPTSARAAPTRPPWSQSQQNTSCAPFCSIADRMRLRPLQ